MMEKCIVLNMKLKTTVGGSKKVSESFNYSNRSKGLIHSGKKQEWVIESFSQTISSTCKFIQESKQRSHSVSRCL